MKISKIDWFIYSDDWNVVDSGYSDWHQCPTVLMDDLFRNGIFPTHMTVYYDNNTIQSLNVKKNWIGDYEPMPFELEETA